MTKYVEIRGSLVTYYKKVDCRSCLHRYEPNSEEIMCCKCRQDECIENNYSEWEFSGSPWEQALGIIEGE